MEVVKISREGMKEVLDEALSDGIITEEQYEKLLSRSEVKKEEKGRGKIQSFLIYTGIIVLIIAVIISLGVAFDEITHRTRLGILSLMTVGVFLGSIYARIKDFTALHFGLLSGLANLFVVTYGYWLIHDQLHFVLGFPLLIVPMIFFIVFIYKDSRWSSQGALFSLVIGTYLLFNLLISWERVDISFGAFYRVIGSIGLALFVISLVINLLWSHDRLKSWKKFYDARTETFHSLLSTGYIFGSIYIFFSPVILSSEASRPFGTGALYMMIVAFLVLIYGVKTRKEGLIVSACGIIIVAMWFIPFSFFDSEAFYMIIVLGILTALILIGIAWFLRRFSDR